LGTAKSRRELRQDCTEADGAVRLCALSNIAARGSMHALARYRDEEASHRLTKADAVFF